MYSNPVLGSAGADGPCDGVVRNIYIQNLFAQGFYLVFSLLYVSVIAKLPPVTYYRYCYPIMCIVMLGTASAFYWPNLSLYTSATILAVMQTLSYYAVDFDNYFMLSVVRDDLYGYFQVIIGVGIALTSLVASGFIVFKTPRDMVLLLAQVIGGVSFVVSLWFSTTIRHRFSGLQPETVRGSDEHDDADGDSADGEISQQQDDELVNKSQ